MNAVDKLIEVTTRIESLRVQLIKMEQERRNTEYEINALREEQDRLRASLSNTEASAPKPAPTPKPEPEPEPTQPAKPHPATELIEKQERRHRNPRTSRVIVEQEVLTQLKEGPRTCNQLRDRVRRSRSIVQGTLDRLVRRKILTGGRGKKYELISGNVPKTPMYITVAAQAYEHLVKFPEEGLTARELAADLKVEPHYVYSTLEYLLAAKKVTQHPRPRGTGRDRYSYRAVVPQFIIPATLAEDDGQEAVPPAPAPTP